MTDRDRAVRIVARELWETAMVARTAIDAALAQVGGRVTVDLVRNGTAWDLAGEWEDVPKHLVRRPIVTERHDASDARFVAGNCDQVAAMAGLSEDDLRDFLRSNTRKPRPADFLEAAARWYDARAMSQAKTPAERKAAQRARARAAGLCIACCRIPVAKPRVTCYGCGVKANLSRKKDVAA